MEFMNNKIVIVGAGMVGSATLSALINLSLVSEIVLIDMNQEKAEGEVLDVSHTTSFTYSPNIQIKAGTYADCKDAHIIVITAGPSIADANESRMSLAVQNVNIIKNIMSSITAYTREAIIIIVTNPLDIVTYAAQKLSGYPLHKIIGTGTLLDTARFRRILGKKYGIDAKNVHGYILGEHGETAFATWSLVDIAGMPLEVFNAVMDTQVALDCSQVLNETKGIGFDIVGKKGYTNYGIAGSVQRLAKAILLNEKSILPVSTVLNGEYGLRDIALSIPCIISNRGIERTVPVILSEDELAQLIYSADHLNSILQELQLK